MQCPSCKNACSLIDFEELGACRDCYQNWVASHDDIVGDDPLLSDEYGDEQYYPYFEYEDDGRYDDDPSMYDGTYSDM